MTENTTTTEKQTFNSREGYYRTTIGLDETTKQAMDELARMLKAQGARGSMSDAIRFAVISTHRARFPATAFGR
jgi:hypothetical protein